MIKIKVKAKKSWPLKTRELIKEAAYWAADKLDIDIKTNDVIIKLMGHDENLRGDVVRLKPNKYLIHVHAKHNRLYNTVFHECAHIKQHIYDGFELLETGSVAMWKHAPYHYDEDEYWTLPWEKEANIIAWKLSKQFEIS